MKKFVIAMVVIILIGAVLTGIGCAVFFSSDFSTEKIEYTEKFFETEEAVSALDLHLENAHSVILARGEKCSVKYSDTNISAFSISAQNGKLTVSESGWSWKDWFKRLFCKFKTTEVIITVPEGVALDIKGTLDGATEANLPSWIYGDINLNVRGASNIVAYGINANTVSLDISGATDFKLSGSVNMLKAYTSGATVFKCEGLTCPLIDMRTSGSTDVSLSGIGAELIFHASGSGKLWAKDFTLERAEIDASGSVDAELSVSTMLKVNTSGSSRIYYWGDPQIDKSTSGSSQIVKKG